MKKKKGKLLEIGDKVLWRGSWGTEPEKEAKVESIEKTKSPNKKYGESVNRVFWNEHFVVTLDNGHWAYSTQLRPI